MRSFSRHALMRLRCGHRAGAWRELHQGLGIFIFLFIFIRVVATRQSELRVLLGEADGDPRRGAPGGQVPRGSQPSVRHRPCDTQGQPSPRCSPLCDTTLPRGSPGSTLLPTMPFVSPPFQSRSPGDYGAVGRGWTGTASPSVRPRCTGPGCRLICFAREGGRDASSSER